MPDAKNNAKASGDVHPPDVEDMDLGSPAGRPNAEGADGDGSADRDGEGAGRKGKRGGEAGNIEDGDGGKGRQRS